MIRKNSISKSIKAKVTTIIEGLTAYRVYLSKCNVGEAYSEYLFYEPVIRMMNHRKGLKIKCEFPIKKGEKRAGDYERIDFVIIDTDTEKVLLLIELKYCKKLGDVGNFKRDIIKLNEYRIEGQKDIAKCIIFNGSCSTDEKRFRQFKENVSHGLEVIDISYMDTINKRFFSGAYLVR